MPSEFIPVPRKDFGAILQIFEHLVEFAEYEDYPDLASILAALVTHLKALDK